MLDGAGTDHVDVLLGSDVLYSSEAFAPLLSTVDKYMNKNPNLVFYMTYQERNSHRVLTPFLQAFCMEAVNIPLSQFVHEVQLVDGSLDLDSDGISESSDTHSNHDTDASETPRSLPLDPLTSIYCIKITRSGYG